MTAREDALSAIAEATRAADQRDAAAAKTPSADTSPTDDGIALATLARGPGRELRIRLREYKGHRYLDIREWALNSHNAQWWPERGKGVTIKLRELEAVIAALTDARAR
jgi:hypothetical protein